MISISFKFCAYVSKIRPIGGVDMDTSIMSNIENCVITDRGEAAQRCCLDEVEVVAIPPRDNIDLVLFPLPVCLVTDKGVYTEKMELSRSGRFFKEAFGDVTGQAISFY